MKNKLILLLAIHIILACGVMPLATVAPVAQTQTATSVNTPAHIITPPATTTPAIYRVCVDSANVRWSGAGMEYPVYTVYQRGHAVYDFGRAFAKDGGEWMKISASKLLYINVDLVGLVCK